MVFSPRSPAATDNSGPRSHTDLPDRISSILCKTALKQPDEASCTAASEEWERNKSSEEMHLHFEIRTIPMPGLRLAVVQPA
jgi:hypothetical protein